MNNLFFSPPICIVSIVGIRLDPMISFVLLVGNRLINAQIAEPLLIWKTVFVPRAGRLSKR